MLQLAIHVERHGSIRLAAKTANLTASVVSRRIALLEDELGVSLFERRSSGLRTTAAGARFRGLTATGDYDLTPSGDTP